MYYISTDDIYWIKYFISLNTEACGNLILFDNRASLYLDNVSEYKEGERPSCIVPSKNRKGFYWHTHPYSSKGYPSTEDILKCLKDVGTYHFLFSKWGIWCMITLNKIAINKEIIKDLLSKYNDNLYHITDKGRYEVDTEEKLKNILEYKEKVEKYLNKFDIKISFEPWISINSKSYYTFGDSI
jgi:hypothetical protein